MWEKIRSITGCEVDWPPGKYGRMMFLPAPLDAKAEPSYWMIGQYKDQTKIATELRVSKTLQDYVAERRVRFGLRKTDVPPRDVDRQERFGTRIAGVFQAFSFVSQRVRQLAKPVRDDAPSINRRTDRDENVKTFWATQTPQSHHIVEFNHLRDIGVSQEVGIGEMDHGQLPCVLLAAEFHQRYFSSILKRTHGWSASRLKSELAGVYHSLYVECGPLFRPLWSVSRIILKAAGVTVPA